MTWRALNAICQNDGAPAIDFERFAARYDAEDETGILHQLVSNFDKSGLVLKTADSEEQAPMGQPEQTDTVEKMAKHALQSS